MSPLCQLIQAHCPHRQHKQDADSKGCKNGPNPIHMLNHGIPASVFVNVGYCRIAVHSSWHS
jgi:hypothetical protein